MAAEFLEREDHLYVNIDEDPISLPTNRYNMSNDPPEWPFFKNFDERETYIRRFLLHQFYIKLPIETKDRIIEHHATTLDEFLAHKADPASPGVVQEWHFVCREGSQRSDGEHQALFAKTPLSNNTQSPPSELIPSDEASEAETGSSPHSSVDEEIPLSSRPVGSLRGSRYAALKARAKTLAKLTSNEDDEGGASDNRSGDHELSPDSVRPGAISSVQPTFSEAKVCGPSTEIQGGSISRNDTNFLAVCSGTPSSPEFVELTESGEGITEQSTLRRYQGQSHLNEIPLPESPRGGWNPSHNYNEIPMNLRQPTLYGNPLTEELSGECCEPDTLDQGEVTGESEKPWEPPPTPTQENCPLMDTQGTESILVKARIVADSYDDTEGSAQIPPASGSSVTPNHSQGAAERVQLHENIVRFVGEVDYWFKPARGDILITHPITKAEERGYTFAPWLRFVVESSETFQDEPSLTDISETGSQSQEQEVFGCLKVWNGMYLREIDEFLQHGDLLLRIGTWKPLAADCVENLYSPYYRVDLYSVRQQRPANKYIFLGYQHPLHLEGIAPSCPIDSPGKYLKAGAPCPSSFAPAIGDVVIRKEAFAMNFAHKENFRRSMVKWYKTRRNMSKLHGLVEQSTEITVGTFLIRPYVGKVESDSDRSNCNSWGGVELYRYESRGWIFWGRDQLLVEFGNRLLKDIPALYVSDPGCTEDNPNYPLPLILARS